MTVWQLPQLPERHPELTDTPFASASSSRFPFECSHVSCLPDREKFTTTVASSGAHFICAYGEQDGYVWTVLIGGYQGSLKVVATVGTKSHYSSVDLSTYDNSICKYVAYSTLFAG